jgi:hypothetical protein
MIPKEIVISENVRNEIDNYILKASPKNNLKKNMLLGLPVKIIKDIELKIE